MSPAAFLSLHIWPKYCKGREKRSAFFFLVASAIKVTHRLSSFLNTKAASKLHLHCACLTWQGFVLVLSCPNLCFLRAPSPPGDRLLIRDSCSLHCSRGDSLNSSSGTKKTVPSYSRTSCLKFSTFILVYFIYSKNFNALIFHLISCISNIYKFTNCSPVSIVLSILCYKKKIT